MEAALEAARAKDTKERLAGVERLHEALEAAARRGQLSAGEVASVVDTCMGLARDGNFRIAQGGLQALSAAAVLAGGHFKIHLNALVPAAVERLGDGKQPVREAARQLLVTLMEVGRFSAVAFSEGEIVCFARLRLAFGGKHQYASDGGGLLLPGVPLLCMSS
jgi:CLIP-associating protein 1/2